tara:strand:- start:50898 stop:51098 length:201 start_codon:yes stop_codon:yes gene_type:complete
MLSKSLSINNREYTIIKSGVFNGEVIIEIRDRKTKELDYIIVNEFTIKTNKPIKQNFLKELVKRFL